MGVGLGEWWEYFDLPPLDDVPDGDPPDVDDDFGADVEREWLESEMPPLFEPDEPPPPWPGESMIVLGSEVLCRPPARSSDDDSTFLPLEHSWVAGLSSTELVSSLVELQRVKAWVDGLTQQALARVADLDATVHMWSKEEVAAALRIPSMTAGIRMGDAQRLCHDLPMTLESLLVGTITWAHTNAVVDTAELLPSELAGPLERRVLRRAGVQTAAQLRRSLRRAAITINPDHAETARKAAFKERNVKVLPGEDGMSDLIATLTAADAAAVYALLDAAAQLQLTADRAAHRAGTVAPGAADGESSDRAASPEIRSKDQIRADLLVDLILGGLDPDRLPSRHGRRPVINVHVSLATLVGQNEEHAWLDGYGPITAETARELSADQTGTWRRLICDPATRRLLAYDPRMYAPPRAVAEHIVTDRLTCTGPGCSRPAESCDLDHATPHGSGGLTVPENLHPACRRHHNAKTDRVWSVRLRPDGAVDWTSPQGRRYRIRPTNRLGPEDDQDGAAEPEPPDEPPPF